MRIALIILVDSQNRILLQQRTDDAPSDPGIWGLFGGACDSWETPLDAVRRETREELCIALNAPKLVHEWHFEDSHPKRSGTRYYFVHRWDMKTEIKLMEGQGLGWFHMSEIVSLPLAPYARPILEPNIASQLLGI